MSPPKTVTPLDLLWIAMWDDLRHNATGEPSGLAIIARYRPQIEAALPSAPDHRLRETLTTIEAMPYEFTEGAYRARVLGTLATVLSEATPDPALTPEDEMVIRAKIDGSYVPDILRSDPALDVDRREALDEAFRDVRRRHVRSPEEGADSIDATIGEVVNDIEVRVRAALDVEPLGFDDLLSIGEALILHYPPDTIVCSHSIKADIGARTAAGIADLIATCRDCLSASQTPEPDIK